MYEQLITRATPAFLGFLIDESKSMNAKFAGFSLTKIEGVANVINKYLYSILSQCERGEAEPRHYFDVAVYGYTTTPGNVAKIRPVLPGALADKPWVSPHDLDQHPLEIHPKPVWYRPPAEADMFGTPTADALRFMAQKVSVWCQKHPKSFPPIIFHLTDGEAFNGDPEPAAQELRSHSTEDGPVLLFNFHLSAAPTQPLLLPCREDQLPGATSDDSKYARSLFRMSSALPATLVAQARLNGLEVTDNARGMALNATYIDLQMLISMGTPMIAQQPQTLGAGAR
jgi:hypothetical protein